MNRYLQAAQEIAQQAGHLLLDEFQRPRHIEYKSEVDIVTAADRRSEAFIVERLGTLFPQHSVVAEEGGGQETASEFCWYVDPLDGTTNFAHGYPFFCVSLALVRGEEFLVGVVHDPIRDETFSTACGEGAWLNRRRIEVSQVGRLCESLLVTGFPTRKRAESNNIFYYERFTNLSHGVRRDGAAALDLCYIACGRFDLFWEFNLQRWDVAAGLLLVREAGGQVTDLQGVPYRLGGRAILASNSRVHTEARQIFSEVAAQRARQGTP